MADESTTTGSEKKENVGKIDARRQKNRESCRESRKKRREAEINQSKRVAQLEEENKKLEFDAEKQERLMEELGRLNAEAGILRTKYHNLLMSANAGVIGQHRLDNSSPILWEKRLRNALLDCNLATEKDQAKRIEIANQIYHPNVSIISIGSSSTGIQAALRHKALLPKVFPDLRFEDIVVNMGGLDGCSVKFTTCGTYNGLPIRYSNVALVSFALGSDLITHKCLNYDAIALLRQLGSNFESFNRALDVNF